MVLKLKKIATIIITFNSEKYINHCIESVLAQTYPGTVIYIVDNSSSNTEYLDMIDESRIRVIKLNENTGFCKANNIAYSKVKDEVDFVVFLNPDAFLQPDFFKLCIKHFDNDSNKCIGVISCPLLGYDIEHKVPTGFIDSLGIYKTSYGKWYDLKQGQKLSDIKLSGINEVPAICGALMFCRNEALKEVLLNGCEVFDNNFYMYKEDIDLSLRLRKKKWVLVIDQSILAYHCRGWNKERKNVPYKFRYLSALNEMRLYLRNRSGYFIFSMFKLVYIKVVEGNK